MPRSWFFWRAFFGFFFIGIFLLGPRDARADDAITSTECSESYQHAQRLRLEGKLRASRDALITCARRACPDFISTDCTRWLGEVEAALPTVVFAAVDQDGSDFLGGEITVDAEPVPNATDGLAHPFDPGPHTIVLRARGQVVEQHVVLRAGDKTRRLELQLPRVTPVNHGVTHTRRTPLATYLLGGVSIVSIGVGISFWAVGEHDANAYNAQCLLVGCTSDQRASVLRELVVGDVAFVAGLVSAGVATIFFLTRPSVTLAVRGASIVLSGTF